MLDRIEDIETDVKAVHGTMLEIEWDGIEGVVCLVAGNRVASATTVSGLADALEKWAAATGLKTAAARRHEKWLAYAFDHVNEMFASRV